MRICKFMTFLFLSIVICLTLKIKVEGGETKKIILIDPGHGGIDGGAVSSSNTLEKDLNLEISLKLKDMLTSEGYKVFMTRDKDISLSENSNVKQKKREDLNKRCAMKRQVGCDIFLSIHMNKFNDSSVSGSQVWYPINSQESKKLSECLQNSFVKNLNQKGNRQPKGVKDDYVILRDGYEKASIIVECGFISNKEEEDKLKNSEYQMELCRAMVMGIKDYFNGGSLN